MFNIKNSWNEILADEFHKEYYLKLHEFLRSEYAYGEVFPVEKDIFSSLEATKYEDVKVVILGQDPYHEPRQAHGMAFSVLPGIAIPPSLANIFKELKSDCGCDIPNNGYLLPWAKQGVLLLNTVLTVQAHHANSHKNKGWEVFTDAIITSLNQREKPVCFLLWGNNAKSKINLISNKNHFILSSVHPSPLSASKGFFGCRHFSKVNVFLSNHNDIPIDWQLPNIDI